MTLSIAAGSTVLFIGDSITEGGRDDARGSIGDGYVRMAADAWAAAHPDHPITVLNRGVGGDRVGDLRLRWTRDAIEVQPDVVTLMVGVNNTWRAMDSNDPTPIDDFTADYRHLLERLRSETSAQILLIEPFILPVRPEQWEWRADLDPRIAVVRRLASEFRTRLLAADGLLTEHAVNADGSHGGAAAGFMRYASDGVHLTGDGAALLASAWLAQTRAA
jgi:acyl-CoA thioesterase I